MERRRVLASALGVCAAGVLEVNWELATAMATVIGAPIALVTLIRGFAEYRRQGAQNRAKHFIDMRKRLKDNEVFRHIGGLVEADSSELAQVSFSHKRDYLGLFEEVALEMNSGLIRKEVAHYMFGYYAISCWESKHFWSNVNRNSHYWALYRSFVSQMREVRDKREFEQHKLRF